MKKKTIVALIVFTALAAATMWFLTDFANKNTNEPKEQHKILDQLEKGLPDFDLQDLNGNSTPFKSYRGKIVLLNFWASWCEPCVTEFPSMIKLSQKFPGDMVFVAVSADEEKSDVLDFIKALKLSPDDVQIKWDPKREIIEKIFKTNRLPETYIIDREGKLYRKVVGVTNWDTNYSLEFFRELISK